MERTFCCRLFKLVSEISNKVFNRFLSLIRENKQAFAGFHSVRSCTWRRI